MTRLRVLELAAALLFGLAALRGAPAAAQPDPVGPADDSRPWAKGVPQEDQEAALTLFSEGNALLRDSLFVKAAEKYREATGHWDHPAIYYNLALALLNLDQPLKVHESLKKTLAFGPAPLGDDKFEHARSYMQLIEKQLATIEVTCDVEGAKVTMDTKPLFVAPGRHQGLVRVGEHNIVATRDGYVTASKSRMLAPGVSEKIEIKMYTPDDLTRYRRKWNVWKPWAVVAGGGGAVLVGGTLHLIARSKFNSYDDSIEKCGGCVPSSNLEGKKDNAKLLQGVAFTSYLLGAATVATGAVFVYMNRARPYRIDPNEVAGGVSVVPVIGPDTAGVSAALRF